MRKVIFFLILTLGWLKLSAQGGMPCATIDQSRDIAGMLKILNGDDEYAKNLRVAYADAINTGLGEREVGATKEWMIYIMDHTTFMDESFVLPSDYWNGVKYGNKISFTSLLGQPSKNYSVYHSQKGKEVVFAKVACMNPQKKKVPVVCPPKTDTTTQKTTRLPFNDLIPSTPQKKKDTVFLPGKPFPWKTVGTVAKVVGVAGLVYLGVTEIPKLFKKSGGPGGADKTLPPPPDTGGPGGAPETKQYVNHNSIAQLMDIHPTVPSTTGASDFISNHSRIGQLMNSRAFTVPVGTKTIAFSASKKGIFASLTFRL